MPAISTPSLQVLSSTLPREIALPLGAALRAQDKHNADVLASLNKALVLTDTLQVFKPYTQSSPLVVPNCWTTVGSFSNSWVDVGAPWFTTSYTKDAAGWVHLRGALKSGTLNTTAFVLPAGFRPGAQWANAVYDFNGASAVVGMVYVDSSGNVKPFGTNNTELHLDGVCFPCSDLSPYVPNCFPFTVVWPKAYAPTAVWAQCLEAVATPSNLALSVPDWTVSTTAGTYVINVRNIPGLLPSRNYAVTLVAF